MPSPEHSAPAHRARKRFGQNFLTDQGIINKIIRAIAPKPDQVLVEIGPGQGALTRPLLQQNAQLHVVELDRDLVRRLEAWQAEYPGLVIHSGDALKFDFAQLLFASDVNLAGKSEAPSEPDSPQRLRVVGNLPYNISTPLIFHLLEFSDLIDDMHFMLQQEVVERMAATAGDKDYGRLSVMVQYFCEVQRLFGVPPECFEPRPKVDSAIVRLKPHRELPARAENLLLLRRLVSTCFQQRRKTLRNNLRSLLGGQLDALDLQGLDIDLQWRPEQLTLARFVALANRIHAQFPNVAHES